ncbi:hypothetical protein ACROYT_G023461 [Oculina patagonica]
MHRAGILRENRNMAGLREKKTLSQLASAGHFQCPKMNFTDRDESDEALLTPKSIEYIMELERIISQQDEIISELRLYLIRKHIRSVHTSSQTEAVPFLCIKPTPPKEGAPRKNTHHRRHKTHPQDGRSLDSCNEKVSSREVAVQTPPRIDQCTISPITCSHILPSNPQKGMRVSIRLSRRRKRSRALHQDVQCLSLSESHDPQTAQPSMQTLPPIPSTEASPFYVQSGTGSVVACVRDGCTQASSVHMTPPCKPEIICATV